MGKPRTKSSLWHFGIFRFAFELRFIVLRGNIQPGEELLEDYFDFGGEDPTVQGYYKVRATCHHLSQGCPEMVPRQI